MQNPLSSKKEKVILCLLGIDKKWTRGENNQWIEFKEEEIREIQTLKTKKWWQFWKRE